MQNYAGDGTVSFALGNLTASASADKPDVSFSLESKGAPDTDGWGTSIYGYDTGAFSFTGSSANKASSSSDYVWMYCFDKQLYTKAYANGAWSDIDYRLAQKSAPDGYTSWYEDDGSVSDGLLVNARKQQVAVTVDWHDDSNAFGTRPSDADLLGKLKLTLSNESTFSIKKAWKDDGASNLPYFNEGGVPYRCFAKGARAVRAPGQPAQRRRVGAHMVL